MNYLKKITWTVLAADRRRRERFAPGGTVDPAVADETAGVCLPALAAMLLFNPGQDSQLALLAAFILFRLFDIAKPWPMRPLERLPAGWGVLVDDLVAGAYAALLIMATAWLLINS